MMQFISQLYNLLIRCVFFIFFSQLSLAQLVDDSWNVVRRQFAIDHQLSRPEVQQQLRWLVSHPAYLNKFKSAEPFIYHIINEIQRRHLPGEIALIPMLESAYNPFAYSGAGAAGLWQLMPKTGRDLGIKGDWWMDGRRHIGASTNAALNYFTYLNRFFHGNWLLAIAAYDCGEGTIQRLLKATPPSERTFWDLPLPQETHIYVPRLLAMAEIIAHPEKYHIRLPYFPHQPYFTEVHVAKQIDLNQAAKLAGISFKDFLKLNPGFNHWATSPNIPSKLLIPTNHVAQFSKNLALLPMHVNASFKQHIVERGETIASIAAHFHTSPNLLINMNHLDQHPLRPGQIVHLPASLSHYEQVKYHPQPLAPKFYKVLHIVQAHENLAQLEKKYQVSQKELMIWNHLTTRELKTGQYLVIWRQTNGNPYYIVKTGDTLNHIALVNHLPPNTIKRLNPTVNTQLLHPGQKIRIV